VHRIRHRPSSIPQTNVSQQRSQFPSPENGLIFGSAKTRFRATDPRGPARPAPKERSLVYACARNQRLIRSEHAPSVVNQHPRTIRQPTLSNRRTDRWHRQRGRPKPACDIGMRSVRGFGGRAYEFRDSQTSATMETHSRSVNGQRMSTAMEPKGEHPGSRMGQQKKTSGYQRTISQFHNNPQHTVSNRCLKHIPLNMSQQSIYVALY
jgi:hypothetical protein